MYVPLWGRLNYTTFCNICQAICNILVGAIMHKLLKVFLCILLHIVYKMCYAVITDDSTVIVGKVENSEKRG